MVRGGGCGGGWGEDDWKWVGIAAAAIPMHMGMHCRWMVMEIYTGDTGWLVPN